jgi:hypothetical protein
VPARRVPEKISRETEQTHVCRLDIPTIVDRIDPSNLGDDNLPTFGNHQPGAPECTMSGRTPRRSWFAFTLALLAAIQAATPAWAWGRLGHRVISRLAEQRLTPAAKAAIAELLELGESLADASTWADEVRGRMRETAPWHYVDVPLDQPRYDAKYSGEKIGCVVDKINEFRPVVKDKSKSIEDRRFALRFESENSVINIRPSNFGISSPAWSP